MVYWVKVGKVCWDKRKMRNARDPDVNLSPVLGPEFVVESITESIYSKFDILWHLTSTNVIYLEILGLWGTVLRSGLLSSREDNTRIPASEIPVPNRSIEMPVCNNTEKVVQIVIITVRHMPSKKIAKD